MQAEELRDLIAHVQRIKAETPGIEVKAARVDCPKRLYDTLSSFSNQDDGGIILFGLDESQGFRMVGVYDAQDLMKKVVEQASQMHPIVRPLFTVLEESGLTAVSAEIPAIDLSQRPCYYLGKGLFKGAYVRVGDADEPMTDYEIYSFEAFRRKHMDDVRVVERASLKSLSEDLLDRYMLRLKGSKPNLAQLETDEIRELMSVTREGGITLASVLLFCPYPQAYLPQLGIIATVVPGYETGEEDPDGSRFLDNRRIEGTLPVLLEDALAFVLKNMRVRTRIDPATGQRNDLPEYPVSAVRECILNALVHRDYSIHTEGTPIQLTLFKDRLEIVSPGGLFGRVGIDQLGKVRPDSRNPVLATAMETLGLVENRYSGIPTIRREMRRQGLQEPQFEEMRGSFHVTLFNSADVKPNHIADNTDSLLTFCRIPRTRKEIARFLELASVSYAIRQHVHPLVKQGLMTLTLPERPQSPHQRYKTVERSSS